MVAHSGAPLGARDLRFLNVPAPIDVYADPQGIPLAIRRRTWQRPRRVAHVRETWRIDDEWWRARPLSRMYHDLILADGARVVVFQDLHGGAWCEQLS